MASEEQYARQVSAPSEELVIEIARELYDRFVMGGWEPQDAYPQIRYWLGLAVPPVKPEAARRWNEEHPLVETPKTKRGWMGARSQFDTED